MIFKTLLVLHNEIGNALKISQTLVRNANLKCEIVVIVVVYVLKKGAASNSGDPSSSFLLLLGFLLLNARPFSSHVSGQSDVWGWSTCLCVFRVFCILTTLFSSCSLRLLSSWCILQEEWPLLTAYYSNSWFVCLLLLLGGRSLVSLSSLKFTRSLILLSSRALFCWLTISCSFLVSLRVQYPHLFLFIFNQLFCFQFNWHLIRARHLNMWNQRLKQKLYLNLDPVLVVQVFVTAFFLKTFYVPREKSFLKIIKY